MYGEFKEHVPGAQRGNLDYLFSTCSSKLCTVLCPHGSFVSFLFCKYGHFFTPKSLRWCKVVQRGIYKFHSPIGSPTGNFRR